MKMSGNDLLISVIIPIYKVENYLNECVDSVLAQTYKNIEVILVNDGSPDNSPAICDEYAKIDNRVVVVHKENGGLSDARNFGLEKANGDYVLFLDSDDYWDDINALKKANELLIYKPDIDILYFDRKYYLNGDISIKSTYDVNCVNGKSKNEILEYFIQIDKLIVSACLKLVKRSILIDNNIKFQKGLLSEDYDWTFWVLIYSKVLYAMDNPFYIYRLRSDSISKTVSDKHLRDILGIIKDWDSKLPKLVSDTEELNLYYEYLGYMYGMLISIIYNSDKKNRKLLISEIKPYKYLLKRRLSNKMKKFCMLYSIVGFDLTWRILGVRNKNMNKNIG